MRVLFVDDDPAYLSACAMILTADGHAVIACAGFNEGRRRLAEGHFDALITDVRLGAYNGLHLVVLAAPSMIKIALSAFPDSSNPPRSGTGRGAVRREAVGLRDRLGAVGAQSTNNAHDSTTTALAGSKAARTKRERCRWRVLPATPD